MLTQSIHCFRCSHVPVYSGFLFSDCVSCWRSSLGAIEGFTTINHCFCLNEPSMFSQIIEAAECFVVFSVQLCLIVFWCFWCSRSSTKTAKKHLLHHNIKTFKSLNWQRKDEPSKREPHSNLLGCRA
jgi:hypothetical protein